MNKSTLKHNSPFFGSAALALAVRFLMRMRNSALTLLGGCAQLDFEPSHAAVLVSATCFFGELLDYCQSGPFEIVLPFSFALD